MIKENNLINLLNKVNDLNFNELTERELIDLIHYVNLTEQRCAVLRLEISFKAGNISRALLRELKQRGQNAA